jgi:hypothetical protein
MYMKKEHLRLKINAKLTVPPRRNAATAPMVAPIESATMPIGRPNR